MVGEKLEQNVARSMGIPLGPEVAGGAVEQLVAAKLLMDLAAVAAGLARVGLQRHELMRNAK